MDVEGFRVTWPTPIKEQMILVHAENVLLNRHPYPGDMLKISRVVHGMDGPHHAIFVEFESQVCGRIPSCPWEIVNV